jgi:DNA-binding MarR family transcriptional regulator
MEFEEIIKHKFTEPKKKAVAHLLFTSKLLSSKIGEALAPEDLTFQQFNILSIVNGQQDGKACVNTIKERMFERNSNVSRLLNKMVNKNWLVKKRCTEDQRLVYVFITKSGEEKRAKGRAIMDELMDTFYVLSLSESENLDTALNKFDKLYF